MKKLIGLFLAFLGFFLFASPALADSYSTNFEPTTFTVNNINGQDGWIKLGAYDVSVVSNTYGFPAFGTQSLRLSDAVTSGSFGDQTFAKPLAQPAGESNALDINGNPGSWQRHFETQFDIASTSKDVQTGMHVSVSPDRGDGARMSYLRFEDQADGIHVFFDDVTDPSHATGAETFNETDIATLDRSTIHTVKISMDFYDGPDNDVVKVYIDGVLKITGTSWEDYYLFDTESNPTLSPNSRTVSTVLFRESGTANLADSGNGFLIDNFSELSGPIPPTFDPKDVCKNGGWKLYGNFKNQGQCVSSIANGKLSVFYAPNSLYYNGPTNSAPLYATGTFSFMWDKSGQVTGGYYDEIYPANTGALYHNVVIGGSVNGNIVHLDFYRSADSYSFSADLSLTNNILTGTLAGPYWFTATGN